MWLIGWILISPTISPTTCTLHTGVDEIALNDYKINSFIHLVVSQPYSPFPFRGREVAQKLLGKFH